MADYDLEIGANCTLQEINMQISGEEAGASEFLRNSLVVNLSETANRATFKELTAGTIPKQLTCFFKGDATPPSTRRVWSGQMVVMGKVRNVDIYRAN